MSMDRRAALRTALRSVALLGMGSAAFGLGGCRPSANKEVASASATPRTDVPLRVLWGGSEEDADTLSRAWGSVSEQSLVVESLSGNSDSLTTEWIDAAKKTDVMIFPVFLTGSLAESVGLIPLAEKTLSEMTQDGRSIPVFHRRLMQWGEASSLVPVGGHQLALLVGEDAPAPLRPIDDRLDQNENGDAARRVDAGITWATYHNAVKAADGQACEPLAKGWAVESYLARIATSFSSSWLFDRATLDPLLTTKPYVDALKQLAETASLYQTKQQTPGEIWRDVTGGQLLFGIGCPVSNVVDDDAEDQPSTSTRLRGLPFGTGDSGATSDSMVQRSVSLSRSLAAGISSACRQTSAANQFLRWLAGGEGSEGLYRQVDALVSRATPGSPSSRNLTSPGYGEYLSAQWAIPNVTTTLRMIDAPLYHAALDQAVRECVLQDRDAKTVLAETADKWQSLTDGVGRPRQLRAWQGG